MSEEEIYEYEIEELKGPFGYRREGGGIVIYLTHSETDYYEAVEQVTDAVYDELVEDEDGEEVVDFAEYDPSTLDSDLAGELQDELAMSEVVEDITGDSSILEKFELFLKSDVIDKNIPLIFIDAEKKKICQIDDLANLRQIIDHYQDQLNIFIREYDHVYDY